MLEGCTPWPEAFVKKYREAGLWVDQTLGDVLNESAERFALKDAIVGDDGTRYTYQDLRRLSDRLALHFLELGLKPQDRVLLQLHNVPEFPIVFFALAKAGLIPVACLAQFRTYEMGYFAELTEPTAYIVPARVGDFAYSEMVEQVRQKVPSIKRVLVHGKDVPAGSVSINKLLADPIEERIPRSRLAKVRPDPTEVAVLLLSGGTTGVPKLIPRTHNDALCSFKHYSRVSPAFGETVLNFTPMAHTMGLIYNLQPTLLTGGKFVICLVPDPERILSVIEKERVNHLLTVPTIALRVASHPAFQKYDVSSMKSIMLGGQRSHPEFKAKLESMFPIKVQETYSMGEGFTCATHINAPEEVRHFTVGYPITPGDELRLVDEKGHDVPEGEMGEIIARGPGVIRGYYKSPEYNATAVDSEGFYHTGDLGRKGPLGGLQIVGRRKDMINRGGEHISAEELDILLPMHPAILNAAVVGMPDDVMGERICAYILTKPGQSVTLPDLCTFLLGKGIAKFKLPERLEQVSEFRIIGLGKIDKKVLREDIARKLTEEKARSGSAPPA